MQRDFPPAETFQGPLPGIPGSMVREVDTLPEHLEGGADTGPYTEAAPKALLFSVPGIARYLVRDGTTVEVAVAPDADRAAARLFLLGSARGALIHQRGDLALGAATVVAPNRKAVAICGSSTIGKSTVAAALCRRGWQLVADDITRISWNGTMAIAWPSSDRIKLWRDACEMMGADADSLERIRDGLERFFLPVRAAATPTTLHIAVRLRVAPKLDSIEMTAAERVELLTEGTFRPRWIDAMSRRADHARAVREIARVCRSAILSGARECSVEDIADRLGELVR